MEQSNKSDFLENPKQESILNLIFSRCWRKERRALCRKWKGANTRFRFFFLWKLTLWEVRLTRNLFQIASSLGEEAKGMFSCIATTNFGSVVQTTRVTGILLGPQKIENCYLPFWLFRCTVQRSASTGQIFGAGFLRSWGCDCQGWALLQWWDHSVL